MDVNERFGELASEESILRAKKSLEAHGIAAYVVTDKEEARKKILELLPQGVEVYDVTSTTLKQIGVLKDLQESGKYVPVRTKIMAVPEAERMKLRKLAGLSEYVVGSVHAVTEDGSVFVASQGGSQLVPYAYGAGKVIWVVGTQKIVKNFDEAMKRVNEYALPLEDERARKVYGVGSAVNKLLIVNKEMPGRISLIFVKEKLGF